MRAPNRGAELDQTLRTALLRTCPAAVVESLTAAHQERLSRHGDFPNWQRHLAALPSTDPCWEIDEGRLVAGTEPDAPGALAEHLHAFIPWRKGPLKLAGLRIDTEWRSDFKWNRIAPHVDLKGGRILDVGAGNGYFGWRMLADGAAEVIGCDPTPLFVLQHAVIRHFAGAEPNHLLAQRLEDLPEALAHFDAVFSMGVLYHRRRPLDHLAELGKRLKPGGLLVLETLVVPGETEQLLPTPDRYAGMRNVHGLPTVPLLSHWLDKMGFEDLSCIDRTPTTTDEQCSTAWMPYHSLAQALDPAQPGQTVEGLPAPVRAVCLARWSAPETGRC